MTPREEAALRTAAWRELWAYLLTPRSHVRALMANASVSPATPIDAECDDSDRNLVADTDAAAPATLARVPDRSSRSGAE